MTILSPGMGGLCLAMGLGRIEEWGQPARLSSSFPPLPGVASGKQDEEPPAVPSHPLRGDDHCHHLVHQLGCPGVPALWGGHSGQHNAQPAQLLVSPRGEWRGWGVREACPSQRGRRGDSEGRHSLGELIWVSLQNDQPCHSQTVRRSWFRVVKAHCCGV